MLESATTSDCPETERVVNAFCEPLDTVEKESVPDPSVVNTCLLLILNF